MMLDHTGKLWLLPVCAIILSFIVVSCYCYYWAGFDDEFITIWSGETLGRDWWFINYNGERSEMTSSILAALVAKVASWIHADAIFLLNKLLLFLFAPAALFLLWHYRKLYVAEPYSDSWGLATLATAASIPFFQYWVQSGMETPLHTFLLTWYAFLLIRYAQLPTTANGQKLIAAQILLFLVRPEGFWAIALTFMALVIVFKKASLSCDHRYIYIYPLVGFVLLISMRTLATGLPFPNPAYAKFSPDNIEGDGIGQLHDFYAARVAQILLGIAVIIGVIRTAYGIIYRRITPDFIVAAGLTGVIAAHQLFFVVVGGATGSFMHRLLVPVMLLMCCLYFHLLSHAVAKVRSRFLAIFIMVSVSIFMVANYYDNTSTLTRLKLAFPIREWPGSFAALDMQIINLNSVHNRDVKEIYPFIQNNVEKLLQQEGELRIATYQAGFFPYFIKKMYPDAPITFFDIKGLINSEVGLVDANKNFTGVDVNHFGPLMAGKHPVSLLLKQFNPNILYTLGISTVDGPILTRMGWKIAYARHYGVIWYRKNR